MVTFIDARQAGHLAKDPRNECYEARWHGGRWTINSVQEETKPSLFPEGPALQREFAHLFTDKANPASDAEIAQKGRYLLDLTCES